MEEMKPWYRSKSVIGGVLAAVAGVAALIGYQFGPAEVEATSKDTLIVIEGVVTIVGAALAIWGRVAAKTRIK